MPAIVEQMAFRTQQTLRRVPSAAAPDGNPTQWRDGLRAQQRRLSTRPLSPDKAGVLVRP